MRASGWDAIVVGAGPAGSSAAAILGAAGKRVLLLDKSSFPREKTCGDGIIYRALGALERLGVLDIFRERVQFLARGFSLCFSDCTELTVRKPAPFPAMVYILPRYSFDQILLENALRYPSVEFLPHAAAQTLILDGETVVGVRIAVGHETIDRRAPVVIDASGVNTSLAVEVGAGNRDSGRCTYALRGYFHDVEKLGDTVEVYFDEEILPGYFWIFPISSTSANVGCGTFLHLIEERKIDLRSALMRFAEQHPIARTRLGKAKLDGPLKGGRIPIPSEGEYLRVRPGFIMVGDAASFADPVTAEGISFALDSGIAAGEVAATALGAEDCSASALAAFDIRWKTMFGRRFARARLLTERQPKEFFQQWLLGTFNESSVGDDTIGDLGRQYELLFKLKVAKKMF